MLNRLPRDFGGPLTLDMLREATRLRPPIWYAITEHLPGSAIYRITNNVGPPEWYLFSRDAFAESAAELSRCRTFRHLSEWR
jgi:hypothetical protein